MNGKLGALRPPRSVVTSRRSRAPVRPAAHAGSKNVSADTLRPTLIVVRRARSRRQDDGLAGGPDVGDDAIVPPVLVVLRLEQSPQVGEVLAVRAPHRQLHDRGHRLGEPGWFTAVAQCHPRRAARLGSPRVGGLHRERASLRAHDQPLAGNELHELVGVAQRAAEESGNELDLRADPKRRRRLPLDRVDVDIPIGSVRRIGGIGRDNGRRPRDDDLGLDVDVDSRSVRRPPDDRDRVDVARRTLGPQRVGPSLLRRRKRQAVRCRRLLGRCQADSRWAPMASDRADVHVSETSSGYEPTWQCRRRSAPRSPATCPSPSGVGVMRTVRLRAAASVSTRRSKTDRPQAGQLAHQ